MYRLLRIGRSGVALPTRQDQSGYTRERGVGCTDVHTQEAERVFPVIRHAKVFVWR